MQTCGNEGRLSIFSEYYVNISTIHPSVRVVIKLLGKILILVSTFSSFSSFSSIEETVGIERVSANLIRPMSTRTVKSPQILLPQQFTISIWSQTRMPCEWQTPIASWYVTPKTQPLASAKSCCKTDEQVSPSMEQHFTSAVPASLRTKVNVASGPPSCVQTPSSVYPGHESMTGVTVATSGAHELQEGHALQPGLVSEYSAVGQARRFSPPMVNRLSYCS